VFRGRHYLDDRNSDMHALRAREQASFIVECPLYRAKRRGKLRPHRDTWLRVEQHLFEPNEVRLRDSEVPR
jgi:hypothetical protein